MKHGNLSGHAMEQSDFIYSMVALHSFIPFG